MKKSMSILLALLMMASGMAFAEDMAATEVTEAIIGRITAVDDTQVPARYTITTLEGDEMIILAGEDTQIDAEWRIGVGDVISVFTESEPTTDTPPELLADTIASFSMEGQVSEVDAEQNRVLVNSAQSGQVWVTLPETEKAEDYAGLPVRIYFNGIMALSLPAQAFAYTIEAVSLETGKILEASNGYYLIEAMDGQFRVNYDEHSKIVGDIGSDDDVQVYYNGISSRSMPPQIFGMAIFRVETSG